MKTLSITDLDSMVHIVSYVQWKAGNREDKESVINQVRSFVSTIEKNAGCTHALRFFQDRKHTNFRKEILPEYKDHRKKLEHVEHWKPTIVEAFNTIKAIPLKHLESDDAMSIIAHLKGFDKVTFISSDKDMMQVPCLQYNPFNPHLGEAQSEKRWKHPSSGEAREFLYQQILTGDSTDMPNTLCGIKGVGPKTAIKKLNGKKSYDEVITEMYEEKYGKEGQARAEITEQMVRLLTGDKVGDYYISPEARTEVEWIQQNWKDYTVPIQNEIRNLFTSSPVDSSNLFNK